jgi:hypothetical protein
MKGMVVDLVTVVSGHRNGNDSQARYSVMDGLNKIEKPKTIAIPHPQPVAERKVLPGVKKVSPEQVIPLEDTELKDF